jgi:hypothetical protein
MPPYHSVLVVAQQRFTEPRSAGPCIACRGAKDDMPSARTVEAKHDLFEPRRERRSEPAQHPPEFHQLRPGDVTPVELEDFGGPTVGMQPDTPTISAYRQRELGSIVEDSDGGGDIGIGNVALGNTTQRVADEAAPRVALGVGLKMLELATAAFVDDVVGTPRLRACRRRFDESSYPRPRETPVLAEIGHLDQVARRRPRNEHDAPVGQLTDAVAAGRKA